MTDTLEFDLELSYLTKFEQEMGIPQGCILSVTLFCLKINSIVKTLLPDTECSLYVDDFRSFLHNRETSSVSFE